MVARAGRGPPSSLFFDFVIMIHPDGINRIRNLVQQPKILGTELSGTGYSEMREGVVLAAEQVAEVPHPTLPPLFLLLYVIR